MSDEHVNAIFQAIDKFTAPIKRMEERTSKFIKSIEKGLGDVDRINDRISGGMKRVAAVGAAAGYATYAVVKDVVATGAEYDKTLVTAAAKFDTAYKRGTPMFEALNKKAQEVGENTEFSAQQAAEGLKMLASAGFSAEQAMSALPVVTDLATASETGYAEASEMAVKSLGAFGLKSEDAAVNAANLRTVVDVLAKTSGKTEASMEGLFESIKEGGPISVAAGQSMQTFMAMAGRLARAGIEGSVAGTTLKNVLLSFSTKKGTTALAALGIKTREANGNMRDEVAIISDLEMKTKNMGTAKRLATLEGIFGKIPLAGVTALIDQGAESISGLRDELIKTDPYSQQLANTMRDTVAGDLDELTSKVDGVKIALFSMNNGAIREVIQGMSKWVAANKDLIVQKVGDSIKWISDNIGEIVKWAKRMAWFVGIFYAWSTAIKGITLAIETYKAAVALTTAANWALQHSMAFFGPPMQGPIQQTTNQVALMGEEAVGAQTKFGALSSFLKKDMKGAFSTLKGGLGAAGLLGAALLVGYEFGDWLNDVTGASDKVAEFYGDLTGLNDEINKSRGKMGGVAAGPGLDPNANQMLADGSIKSANGEWVLKTAARQAQEAAEAAASASKVVDAARLTSEAAAQTAQNAAVASGMPSPTPQVVSPSDRVAQSIDESRTTESAEVTIKDKTQRAEVTKKPGGDRVRLKMRKSGSM